MFVPVVTDMNDNAPVFSQPSYRCSVSEGASRGQFVSHVTAYDEDTSDENKLVFSIVSGNTLQAFTVDSSTGKNFITFIFIFNVICTYIYFFHLFLFSKV